MSTREIIQHFADRVGKKYLTNKGVVSIVKENGAIYFVCDSVPKTNVIELVDYNFHKEANTIYMLDLYFRAYDRMISSIVKNLK